jgi:hypothetical protein
MTCRALVVALVVAFAVAFTVRGNKVKVEIASTASCDAGSAGMTSVGNVFAKEIKLLRTSRRRFYRVDR